MQFLQLLQKTGMNSSLLRCTVVLRNASGENWQTHHSLAEAFSGRQDTTASNARATHCQELSPLAETQNWKGRRCKYFLEKPKSSQRTTSNSDGNGKPIPGCLKEKPINLLECVRYN